MVDAYSRLEEENVWPRSYNLYSGTIRFQIAAQDEEQAIRRLKQLEQFLQGLVLDPIGYEMSHESVLYVYPHPDNELKSTKHHSVVEFEETVTVESLHDVRPSMVSGDLPVWSWLLPDADKDYDPDQAARKVHCSEYDPTEWE